MVSAGSGEAALERRAARPTSILMDINLPGMSGIEALARLRAEGVTVPVRR